jgi:glutathione S-transferase
MRLYGSVNKRSFNTLKIRAALAEARAEFAFIPVDLPKGEARTPAFLALNPHGKIPVLVDGDFALAESDAILWYVGEKFPEARLLPAADGSAAAAQGRARVLQWCAFASSALYAAYLEWWTFGHGTEPDKRVAAVADGAVAKVDRAVAVMQAVLADREHLAGAFSLGDLASAAVLQSLRNRLPDDPLARYDRVRAWYDRVTARPAWTEANG